MNATILGSQGWTEFWLYILLKIVSCLVFQNDQLTFSKMVSKNKRKQVAQKFYSILVLQKALAVNVQQEGDNGDIFVSRGPRFETAVF